MVQSANERCTERQPNSPSGQRSRLSFPCLSPCVRRAGRAGQRAPVSWPDRLPASAVHRAWSGPCALTRSFGRLLGFRWWRRDVRQLCRLCSLGSVRVCNKDFMKLLVLVWHENHPVGSLGRMRPSAQTFLVGGAGAGCCAGATRR